MFPGSDRLETILLWRMRLAIMSVRDTQPEVMRIRLGTLDTPVTKPPVAHIFAASKAAWDVIHDDLPQYPERPPA